MQGLRVRSDSAVAQDVTVYRGPCSNLGWRCQKAISGKLDVDAAPRRCLGGARGGHASWGEGS